MITKDNLAIIPNCPIVNGFSVYSQNDEDGILEDIFGRTGISNPNFFEFGVAPEENNTNYMLLKGSRGCWVDKGLANFKKTLPPNKRLKIFDTFVKMDNITSILTEGCQFLGVAPSGIDFISLDLDGNDFYFINKIISAGILPKVFCLEYNAIFRPPISIKIEYNENHQWSKDDYFGCSLAAYQELLSPHYSLVSCNMAGSNCFYVKNELMDSFTKYSISALYQPPRYYHSPFSKGHPPTSKFIIDLVSQVDL